MRRLAKLNGVLSVYKPRNVTSAECCNIVKTSLLRDLNLSHLEPSHLKVGHGGTLDMDATGVLPVGLGSGCKLLTQFLHGPKTYLCHSTFGLETDTGYMSGKKVVTKSYDHVTHDAFMDTLNQFVGRIYQVPPIFSALKYNGRRLSDLAFAGEVIPSEKLVPRLVEVLNIRCVMFEPPDFILEITCGGGCYVRSIVRDLSHALSTCAFVSSLERTVHGSFSKEHSLSINMLSYESILSSLKYFKN